MKKTVLLLLFFVPFLTNCGTTPVVVENRIPTELLTCADEPAPGSMNSQKDVAHFIIDLRNAGQDCRDKVNAIRLRDSK